MGGRSVAGPAPGPEGPRAVSRRRVLAAAALAPLALGAVGGCSAAADGPDPLAALAAAARADAALAAAAVAGDPALAPRLEPLRSARTEHAAALDAEVARTDPQAPPPAPAPAPASAGPTLQQVRAAVAASARAAADLVAALPAERAGLVGSVAACCATYAVVLT